MGSWDVRIDRKSHLTTLVQNQPLVMKPIQDLFHEPTATVMGMSAHVFLSSPRKAATLSPGVAESLDGDEYLQWVPTIVINGVINGVMTPINGQTNIWVSRT